MKNIITYKGFIGTIGYSAEDHLFFGKIEGIEDLITFEGETVTELETAFKYMVDQHIVDCKAEGKPAEKSYKGVLNVRLSPRLHKQAAQSAMIKGITLNQMIKQALENELEKS